MLTDKEVMQRLCALLSEVAQQKVGWEHQTDCICQRATCPHNNDLRRVCPPMQDGAALEYVEQTVRAALTSKNRSLNVGDQLVTGGYGRVTITDITPTCVKMCDEHDDPFMWTVNRKVG